MKVEALRMGASALYVVVVCGIKRYDSMLLELMLKDLDVHE